jgi:DNA repair protein RadC
VHEKAPQNGRTAGVSETRPHFYGHRERLRGRFREAGADSVSDYELLELVLFRAIPQRDVKLLAKDLIARFGAFPEVISAPPARLAETKESAKPTLPSSRSSTPRQAGWRASGQKTAGAVVLGERHRLLSNRDGFATRSSFACSFSTSVIN